MKRLSAAVIALVFSAGAASAQDVTFDWSGAYIGVQTGYGWGNGGSTYVGAYTTNIKPDGFLAGMFAGYNHQLAGNLVLGVDADITWTNGSDWAYLDPLGKPPINDPNLMDRQKLQWSAALRGRIGYALDRFLPYVAGGIGAAKVQQTMLDYGTYIDLGGAVFTGWTAGAGIDYAWSDNILVRAEYRYSDFGNKVIDLSKFVPPTWKMKSNDIRFGIAYKF